MNTKPKAPTGHLNCPVGVCLLLLLFVGAFVFCGGHVGAKTEGIYKGGGTLEAGCVAGKGNAVALLQQPPGVVDLLIDQILGQIDVVMLLEYGYDELEIEEMLYDPLEMQKCISEIKLCEMMC